MKRPRWLAGLALILAAACLQSCSTVTPDATPPEPSTVRADVRPQRFGIDGAPVPLDSTDPKYRAYFEQVRSLIQAKWGYPCVKQGLDCHYKTTNVDIEFGISKDGRLVFVTVMHGSEWSVYNDYAAIAIKNAEPFPPVPDALLQGNGLPIRLRFKYEVQGVFPR